jgi:hypothetical protein
MGWDFKKKSTAETLLRMAEERLARETGRLRNYIKGHVGQSILVKTPQGGIPARQEIDSDSTDRDEYDLGTAECTLLSTYDGQTSDIERSQQYTRSVRRPDSTTLTEADGTDTTTGQPFDWRDGKKVDGPDLGEVKVWVANPYVNAIAGDKIILAHYIDGSYVVAEPPMGTRIRFALKTDIVDGSAIAYILDPPPAQGENYSEVTVYDTRKSFVGAVGIEGMWQNNRTACIPANGDPGDGTATGFWGKNGSIGWANFSSSIGPSGGAGGYEIESCTMPADRWVAITEPTAPTYTGSNKFKGEDSEYGTSSKLVFTKAESQRSVYPNNDFPPEFKCITLDNSALNSMGMEFQFSAYNPNKFSIMPGSSIELERLVEDGVATEYDSIEHPLVHPLNQLGVAPTGRWVITGCSKEVAKWIQVTSKVENQDCIWEYTGIYKDGGDPKVYFQVGDTLAAEADIPVIAAPGIEYCCKDGSNPNLPETGSLGWAWWDRQSQEYVVVATKSAMLGDPSGEDFISDVSDGGTGDGCSVQLAKHGGMVGWQCVPSNTNISLSLKTTTVDVVTGLGGGCNQVCSLLNTLTVLDCNNSPPPAKEPVCIPIYADPCTETPCSGECTWAWNTTDHIWEVQSETCPDDAPDCGCYYPPDDPEFPDSTQPTENRPCGPANFGCPNCSLCDDNVSPSSISFSTNGIAPNNGVYTSVVGEPVEQLGDCRWRMKIRWTANFVEEATDKWAEIEYDGTFWFITADASDGGLNGDFIWDEFPEGSCNGTFTCTAGNSDCVIVGGYIAGEGTLAHTVTTC